MCLSDAFEIRGEERAPLMKYVSGMHVEGDVITLTDMMGAKKIIRGVIKNIDLLKNEIFIEAS